ncbi:rhodanese-like domain-containing protein [Halobellus limi]|uniref:Rhodanese-like domain-containing protein n=1 Tax=Halobellus limi TaxID=699433 RepID=A0A1H6CPG2_9EURY|nr:rhodanese-like domain-containing protein [Halobellus limi]QCC48666.1 rhodanese-like domain-containing protein [Halobellus limi]SEG74862.1 thiosulfate sulfurtransferase [Halobellus limi]
MVTETTPEELKSRLHDGDVAVVDIRDPSSYAAGHIEGAVNVPPNRLSPAALDAPWAAAEEVVVSCYVGKSSKRVAAVLSERLDADVSSLRGGFDAWDGPVADGHGDDGGPSSEGPGGVGDEATSGHTDAPF